MRRIVKIFSGLALGSVFLLAGVFFSLLVPAESTAKARPQPRFNNQAWVAWWDYPSGLKEAKAVSSQLNSVSYFGAALDSQGQVVILGPARGFTKEKLPRYHQEVQRYLSVVNDVYTDVQDENAPTKLKDTAILEDILATPELRQKHVDQLIKTTKEHGFDGLEIDYERVWRNPLVAIYYVKFIQALAKTAEAEKLPVRIILEPSVPANRFIFPAGPEYVLMCYNLYGLHTKEGGPKADTAFIASTLDKVSRMPRPHSIAFATGGCVWENGKPRLINEKEARKLADSYDVEPVRDATSGALTFTAEKKDGTKIEGWYADAETLNQWKHQALEHGVDGISLWRLGGNYQIEEYYPGIINNQPPE